MKELELPEPDINLGIGSGSQGYQVGTILIKLEEFFLREQPAIVAALGDTNSVFGAALAAEKMHIPFAHIEAGIRSFDRSMPEEVNRVLADQISSYCFAPTKTAVANLRKTETMGKIFLTGNSIVEAVQKNIATAKKSRILEKLGLKRKEFVVLTMHRQENVDSREKLESIANALEKISQQVVFPMHPRTKARLQEFSLKERFEKIKNLMITESMGYFDFLQLCSNSRYILSDSGGIQEEASVYKKFVIVLRENTERPEMLGKFAVLAGFDEKKIIAAVKKIEKNYPALEKRIKKIPCPFGNGKASGIIAEKLAEALK